MKAIQKDFWREIRNTRSRFASILILVALAVAFLSGLRSTAPDMKNTCDSYLDQQNFMDIQVLSTLGLTEEDFDVLLAQPGISGGEIGWSIDAYAQTPDLDIVAKVHSLPQTLNTVTLTDGRMPQAADECVVEEHLLELLSLEIGDSLTLATSGDYEDALTVDTVTIAECYITLSDDCKEAFRTHVEKRLRYTADALAIDTAAEIIGYSRGMVLSHIQQKHIDAVRISGKYIISKAAIVDFLVSDIAFGIVNKSAWHMNTILMFSNKG